MAILTTTKVTSGTTQMPGVGDGQSCKVVAANYAWTSAPALNDVIVSPLIQAGSVITDVVVVHTGLGPSGAFKVGYTLDDDYFVVAGTQVSGGVVRMSAATALPLVLTTNDTIDVTVTAAGANATGTISIIVYFTPLNA